MELASLFSDGAVLQCGQSVPVWGKSIPRQVVKAELAGVVAYAATSTAGEFIMRLPPMDAGGPYTLTVSAMSEDDKIIVYDILIGEVWLASGQSNMEYCMKTSTEQLNEFNRINHDVDTLRMFTVEQNAMAAPENSCLGTWKKSDSGNAADFSAVALWFAFELRKHLNVPIGIISSSWGGTIIQAWTSRNTLLRNQDIQSELINSELNNSVDYEFWENINYNETSKGLNENSDIKKFAKLDPGNIGFGNGWASPDFNDSDWHPFQVPGSWVNQNLCGNGALWGRLEIIIPDSWEGKELCLDLGGIDKHDTTYFNGVQVGSTGKISESCFWDKVRHYRIPPELVRTGRAVIAVRGYSFIYDGSFNGIQDNYRLYPEKDRSIPHISLAGTWKAKAETDYGKVSIPKYMPGNPNSYGGLFNSMIRPLIPYSIRGTIWYQGETNACSVSEAIAYHRLLIDFINDWRWQWGQSELPFYVVNLAGYHSVSAYQGESPWAHLRESQRKACLEVPDCAMAAAIDCGEEDNIHPYDKKTIGERLSRQALANTYQYAGVVSCGPVPLSISRKGNELHIHFDYIADGLNFKNGIPRGFFIAGKDGFFKEADSVEIAGSNIVLKSSAVKAPLRVRYAWADNPDGNFCNSENLPAFPFELLTFAI